VIDFTKNVLFSDTVFAQQVDGEMVLLDMNNENYVARGQNTRRDA